MGKVLAAQTLAGEQGDAINKYGINTDVDIATAPEDIWSPGGLFPFASFLTAQTIEVVSSSGVDTGAGTGARTVLVEGVDGVSGEIRMQTITLTGAVAVILSGTWLAINRIYIITTGSGNVNAGTINAQVSVAGAVVAQVPIGMGQTQQAVYRVPANHFLLVSKIDTTFFGNFVAAAAISLQSVGLDGTVRRRNTVTALQTAHGMREFTVGAVRIESLEWCVLRVLSTSADNVSITGEFDGVLYNNAQDR